MSTPCTIAACHRCEHRQGSGPLFCAAEAKLVQIEHRRDVTGCPIGLFEAGNWMVDCKTMKPAPPLAGTLPGPVSGWREPDIDLEEWKRQEMWRLNSNGSEGCGCSS